MEELNEKIGQLQLRNNQKQTEHTEIMAAINQLVEQQATIDDKLLKQKEIIEQNSLPPEHREAVQAAVSKYDAYQNAVKEMQEKQSEVDRRTKDLTDAEKQLNTQRLQDHTLTEQMPIYENQRLELQGKPPADPDQLSKDENRLLEGKVKADYLVRLEEANSIEVDQLAQLEKNLQKESDSLQNTTQQLGNAQEQLAILRQQHKEVVMQDKRAMAAKLAADLCAGVACLLQVNNS